eukprot:TRINITY_DN52623_c0_g1_i1.p2 TRINITY_DN52623_c0_g1~~TRINITY_DN52623_c0_g1_i1.p2  ORF type:complete len:136 (-),score=7.66 TRINITY_DN52623_c0_g1_i1:314-721(-)
MVDIIVLLRALLAGVAAVEDAAAVEVPRARGHRHGDGALLERLEQRIHVVRGQALEPADRDDLGRLGDEVSLALAGDAVVAGGVGVERLGNEAARLLHVIKREFGHVACTSALATTMRIRCATRELLARRDEAAI